MNVQFKIGSAVAGVAKVGVMAAVTLGVFCTSPMRTAAQQAPAAQTPGKAAATSKTGKATPKPKAKTAATSTATNSLKRLPDGHPDFNGFWESSAGVDSPVGGFGGYGGGGRRRNEAAAAAERLADPNQPPYKPELMAKVKAFAMNESNDDPAFFCKPGGVPRVGPPHGIIQAAGMPILLIYQVVAGNTYRIVNMDGRPHDAKADYSYYGDAIGHWEGDTLVVDTTNLNDDTWLGIDGWFHTDALHVIERLTREGDTMHYQSTVEDPNVFTRPWTMNVRKAKLTQEQPIENAPCVEQDSKHIVDPGVKTRPQ